MAKDTGKKLIDMMYGQNPDQAAFGVYPQLKPKRTAQDPQAAKNVPVDLLRGAVSGVLGAPGDIESLIRLLPGLDENTVLPTSEDIEKRLPFKSDTPVSRAATGLGQIGGGFYTGPGSPLRLVGALPGAVKRAGQDFAFAAGQSGPQIFVGPRAKTWDSGRAAMAEAMEEARRSPEEIWQATGTFRGKDGIWRQEIDDRAARFLNDEQRKEIVEGLKGQVGEMREQVKPSKQKDLFPKALTEARKEVKEKIGELKEEIQARSKNPSTQGLEAKYIFEHPELYKAYPELADLNVTTGGGGGGNTLGALSVVEKNEARPGAMQMDVYTPGLRNNPTSTTLHEMQHAVQTLEGMGPGGSPTMAFSNPEAHEILKRLREEQHKPAPFFRFQQANKFPEDVAEQEYQKYLKEFHENPIINPKIDRMLQERAAMEYYKRLAGEAEARAVQDRQLMTPAQRMENPPPASYDVPQEDLIVKPPREFAEGGQVVISEDPDVMQMELAGGGEVRMDEGGAAFGKYTTGKKYQAAKKRAEDADVNLLPDPKTYAVVQGLLGTAPDEMGFSVLHPKYQEIKEVADPAFAVGTALQVMPAAKPGALALARKGERLAERVVPGIMERGGLPADILSGLTQGSASYAYRPHTPLKPDPDVGTRYKKQFIGGLVPRQDLDIESLEKSSAKIFPWDATSRNQLITEVSDVPLTKPVLTEGGDEYMMDVGHVANRIAGASNIEIAKRIKDRIDQAAAENQMLGGTGKVYGFPVRMGERAEHFSTFPADIAMDLMKQAGLKKKELKELTNDLKTMVFEGKPGYFKNIAPVGTPEFEQQLREGLAKTKTEKGKDVTGFTAGNLRKGLMDRLGKVEYQKRLGYNLPDLTGAVLSDVLKGVPKGYVGNVAAELDPFTALRPSKSSSYSHDFSGQYVGSMPNMPVEFLMPNTFESYYRHFKKEYPSANEGALRNMAIGAMEKRKESISEMIGPRSVDAVKTYQEGLMKGEFDPNDIKQVYDYMRRKKLQLKLAAGGAVEDLSPSDMLYLQSQPDIGKLSAQEQREYVTNIKPDELRQRMQGKYAGGGEITADDLILEERKL